MGNFEIKDLTCADCVWGSQCCSDSLCADFDPLDENIEAELFVPNKDEFAAEYIAYCASAQNNQTRYITSFAKICKGV